MKLRRIAAAFLAVLMVLPLAACGEKEPEMTDEEKYSFIARQLANTSWMVQGSPYSTVYTFTINFGADLSFSLYGESFLHGNTEVECDAESKNLSVSTDATGHNFGIKATAGGYDVSIPILCDENLNLDRVGYCSFYRGGIRVTGSAKEL